MNFDFNYEEQQYIILGESEYGSKWLAGFPNTNKKELDNNMSELKKEFPNCHFTIIPYTINTFKEIYPDLN